MLRIASAVVAATLCACGSVDEPSFGADADVAEADDVESPDSDAGSDSCPPASELAGYCNNEGPVFCSLVLCVDRTHYRRPKSPTPCADDPCCPPGCTGSFTSGYDDTIEPCEAGSHCVSVCAGPACAIDDAGTAADAATESSVD